MTDLPSLYSTQISLTEWFAGLNHAKTDQMRQEDNSKRDRLAVLNQVLGLPFDRPHEFSAVDLSEESDRFLQFFQGRTDQLCALRLIPIDPALPKLRMRGDTVRNVMAWFKQQKIDPSRYHAHFIPHAEKSTWSTIFIVNKNGIFGNIIRGGHYQLTQGVHDAGEPMTFASDFHALTLHPHDPEGLAHLNEVLKWIKVTEKENQQFLTEKLNAQFNRDYLSGYFETVSSTEYGLWFCDFNRILGEIYGEFSLSANEENHQIDDIRGTAGSKGVVQGRVRIVNDPAAVLDIFQHGEILLCQMTTPSYLPLMGKAKAIVTDLGGILSHAAIIARELHKPCIVGTKNATQLLKDGDLVEVDANHGTVRKLA